MLRRRRTGSARASILVVDDGAETTDRAARESAHAGDAMDGFDDGRSAGRGERRH